MLIDNDFKKFINISAKLSGNNTLFITDLEKIILCSSEDYENLTISNILLRLGNNLPSSVLIHPNLINILEENNPIYISQIILPIIIESKLYGYFISISNNTLFEKVHLDYANTTLYFIKKFLKKCKE